MNTQEIINLISKYEENPTPELLKDLIGILHNNIDTLPINQRIKLMHAVCKPYDYGNSYGIDEDILAEYKGELDDIEWEEDLLSDILSQCELITDVQNSSDDSKQWIDDFYLLIKKLIEEYNNFSGFEEQHLKLLKFCADNKNYDLCESYVGFFESNDDKLNSDIETCAFLYPFCDHDYYSNLYEVIAKAYSIYANTGVIERLNDIIKFDLQQSTCKDPNSIDEKDVLTALEEMERTQNNDAISVWCNHTVCYKNISSKNDSSERLAEKIIKHYLSNELTLEVEDFRNAYQKPFINKKPLNILKEELDRNNTKAEELADILLTKKSKQHLIDNNLRAKAKKQNHTSSDESVCKIQNRRKRHKKSPLKLLKSLLLPKRRSNSFQPKARNTKHLKEESFIWGKSGCWPIILSIIGIVIAIILTIVFWNKFPENVKSIIKWSCIGIGVIVIFIIGGGENKEN